MRVDVEVPDLVELAGDIPSNVREEGGPIDLAGISDLYFEEDDEIRKGELFAVIESSYKTYEVTAPASGRIIKVSCKEGDAVSSEDVLGVIDTDL